MAEGRASEHPSAVEAQGDQFPLASKVTDQIQSTPGTTTDSSTQIAHSDTAGREAVDGAREPGPAASPTDYRWLAALLRDRIVQLKRYPVEARTARLEGRVVVRAVIDRGGAILDATVALSSGHDLLDRDAVGLVQKAGPLALRESISQHRIILKVPVSYSLKN